MEQPVTKSSLRNALILIARHLSLALSLMAVFGYVAFSVASSTASRESVNEQAGKAAKKLPPPQSPQAQVAGKPNVPSAVTTTTMTDNIATRSKVSAGSTINYTDTINSTGTFLDQELAPTAVFTLTSSGDSHAVNAAASALDAGGFITLRSAMEASTAQGGAHIITIPAAIGATINLTLGQMTVGNAAVGNNITVNGPGMGSLTVNQTTDNRVFSTGTGAVTFVLQNLTLNCTAPGAVPYSGGGGAIIAGGLGASTTLNNVAINNFRSQIGNGGAFSQSSSLNAHTLTITNCTFTNNRCGGAGGAVSFNSQAGTATITGCTFTGNHTGVVGANTGGDGGAIATTGGGAGGTYLIEKNTFLNNQVENVTGHAGAVINTNGTLTLRYNRFIGNTCLNVANPPLANIVGQAGGATTHVTIADNNWWGVNTGPGANDATALNAGAVMTLTKWLQLKTTASPNPICNTTPTTLGNTSTVTTSFLSNSASEAIAVANLTRLIGLPVTWTSTLGSLSGQQATIQAAGTATALFTSNGTAGTATVNTQVDNVPAAETSPARASITVNATSIAPTGATGTTTVCNGGTTTLTVSGGLKGTGAVTQWYTGSCGGTLAFTGDAFLTPSLMTSTTYFVRYNGTCNTTTCATVTVTVNAVTGGTVGSDQTICSGGDPALFTQSVASTGSGALTYQWQSSTTSCAAGFSNIGGATATTYDPPAGLSVTTFYRRVTTSTLNTVPCTAISTTCITVTINNLTGGTVATDQTICSAGDPAAFTQSVASTGSGALTYQWQSSTTSCAAGFSNIGGATATTYDPPAGLSVTTFYRRVTTSTLTAVPCTANSNCITVTVNGVTGGTVATDQTICSGGNPALFTQSVASTGSGALTYQWQSSTTSCAAGFSNIGGATATTYDPPTGLLVTTFYRRVTTSTLTAVPCTANSNCITVNVNNVSSGTVAADQTICSGADPALFTESVASTGSGALTYQWQSSTTSCAAGFSNIGGATSATYDAPAGLLLTTFYRRVTTSTLNAVPCTANSNCITVTINSVTGGTVGSDQAFCSGGNPAAFTQSVASTGSGPLTYQWQSSTTSCVAGFSNIGGATATTYDPPAGLAVTTYYQRVTTSTFNAVLCTANSNCITVTVNANNTITLTSAAGTDAQTVPVNTAIANVTYATTGATGATFSGLPPGVNGNWAANVATLSGTPTTTAGSPFNYTVTPTGGCGGVTANGSITVTDPTEAKLESFAATGYDGGTFIEWRTGFEVDNLGFNLYRDEGGKRVPINSQMVAGSALTAGSGVAMRAGQSYAWWDGAASKAGGQYWLESIDLNGQSSWHGPFSSKFIGGGAPARSNSSMLGRIEGAHAGLTLPVVRAALPRAATPRQMALQSGLPGQAAVKMWVKREGFYRVTASELAESGFDPRAETRFLQLYADGQQIPINVISDKDGLLSAIEFYGRGLDAAFTDQRVYWLVSGSQPGVRINYVKASGQPTASQSFLYTAERRDRTIYFSGLRNGERENFFGAVIAASPVDQSLTIQHVDQSAIGTATMEVGLQGVTKLPHKVWVYLNGGFAGEVAFDGQTPAVSKFNIAQTLLRSGENQVRLVAQAGTTDISLVDYISLSYWHSFTADDNALRLTAVGNQQVTIDGFTSGAIRVLDVTDPDSIQELGAKIEQQKSGYAVTVASPGAGERRLLAIDSAQASKPAKIAANQPSGLRTTGQGADFVMLAPREFFSAIEPLRALRNQQGLKVELADIEDVFDEFSFGNKSPQAMKDFLQYAATSWKIKPRYVLLVGDASYDAKNYLGLGDSDLVPTRLVDTSLMETASDDWLADFNADGIADLAVGRLAARTPAEASAMVRKIIGYERSAPLESMLLVADVNNGFDFESAATQLRALIPGNLRIEQINRGELGDATAKSRLIDAITRGQKVVNYMGHGSVNLWSGSLLTNDDAANLTNVERLPVFVMMTCLNGYFHDPALDSLAESLLKAEDGGAVAVWTSTGMTTPLDQSVLNRQLYQLLFAPGNAITLGEATARAKAAVNDGDIRRTWVLLGDPTMRLK